MAVLRMIDIITASSYRIMPDTTSQAYNLVEATLKIVQFEVVFIYMFTDHQDSTFEQRYWRW